MKRDRKPLHQCPGSRVLPLGFVEEVIVYLNEVMLDTQNLDYSP